MSKTTKEINPQRTAIIIIAGLIFCSLVLMAIIKSKGDNEPDTSGDKGPVAVITQEVKTTTLVDSITFHGNAAAWERLRVAARVPSIVSKIFVDEGSRVSKDDLLCKLDNSDYLATVASVEAMASAARAQFELAAKQFTRVKALHKEGAINDSAFDSASSGYNAARAALEQAEAGVMSAKLALSRTEIRAPISGVVTMVAITNGQLVNPGDAIAVIADVSKIRVTVGIPERDVLAVRKLEDAPIKFKAINGREFTGTRIYLGAEPSSPTRTYPMEFAIDNHEELIRPGMIASVKIVRGINNKAIMVPAYSIIPREKDLVLFVVENNIATRRVVERGVIKGFKADMEIEITSGLKAGDKVIIKGQRNVDDGQEVQAKSPAEYKKMMQEKIEALKSGAETTDSSNEG